MKIAGYALYSLWVRRDPRHIRYRCSLKTKSVNCSIHGYPEES